MVDPDRLAVGGGVLGPLVGFAATLAAATISPTFRWTGNALSDLGASGAANPLLFNGGLVLSALATLPFGWALRRAAGTRLERLGVVLFVFSTASLGLVGVFPSGTALHRPVAVAYFVGLTFTCWVHGAGWALRGSVRRGLIAICLGIGHVLLWVGWLAAGTGGIAVPEIGGSLTFYGWLLLAVRSLPGADR